MNNRVERMIRDVETEYGIEISVDDLPNVLCDGDICRHSECDCWDWYGDELERIAKAKILPPEIVGQIKTMNFVYDKLFGEMK